jgi:hypothetical protein
MNSASEIRHVTSGLFSHKLLALLAGVLLLTLAIVASSWLRAHDAWVHLQQKLEDDRAWLVKLDQHEKTVKAEADAQVAAIQKSAAQQQTPQQIVRWLPAQIPAPAPIKIEVPQATPSQPAPPAIATVPQEDLAPLRDLIAKCQSCEVELPSLQAQLADERQKNNLLTGERDAALKAARGGGFFTRLKRAARWFAIGAAVGAAAVCGSGHCK